MSPIDPHGQQITIQGDASLPLIVSVMGNKEVLAKVSPERLQNEVDRGIWDEPILTPVIGPKGSSLLLCLMGTQHDIMGRSHASWGAALTDISNLAQAMVSRGADPFWQDADGRDCLDQAFASSNLVLLSDWSSTISAEQMSERTHGVLPWLHRACARADLAMATFLLDRGVDVNQPTPTGETPLFLATTVEVVQLLLSHGANPEHRNNNNADARVFWARPDGLTQADQVAMVAKLPPPSKSRSRQTRVDDFYTTAHTAGKGVLVKQMKALELLPQELDRNGFSLVGSMGQRLQDAQSSSDGIVRNKTVNCLDVIAALPHFLAAASEKDWISLWVGACRFGGANAIQDQLGLLENSFGRDPDFWVKCVEQVHAIAPSIAHGGGGGMFKEVLSALPSIMKNLEQAGIFSEELGRLHMKTRLAVVNPQHATYGQLIVREQQQQSIAFMRASPLWKEQETEEAWQLALTIDKGYSGEKKDMFSPQLAEFLLDAGVRIPASAIALAQSQMSTANDATVASLVEFQAGVLQQETVQVAPSQRRGPRL